MRYGRKEIATGGRWFDVARDVEVIQGGTIGLAVQEGVVGGGGGVVVK